VSGEPVPGAADVARAAVAGEGVIRMTPLLSSRTLGDRAGGEVVLKAENLQRTGSFKLRGALAKIAALGDGCANGVVAGSAGNHAQAVAYAARARGVACEVYMPQTAPIAKVEAAGALGATVRLTGQSVDDAIAAARERAATGGLEYIHPFDDRDVIAGQGTLGAELLEQVGERLARVLVPVGGGGLASGIAIAIKARAPRVEVIGIQAPERQPTIADGIAVKQPGRLTGPLLGRYVDRIVRVAEDDIAEAMIFLLERAKLVVEGAGAVGVAALLSGTVEAARDGVTAVVLSGGNVDAGLLAQLARRHESLMGRRLVLTASVPDIPGSLARLLAVVAQAGANLLDVQHVREGFELHVRESLVQLVLETRSRAHAEVVTGAVRAAGYAEPRPLR
jgi:threonine dehydratase